MDSLAEIVARGRAAKHMNVVGIDANAVIGRQSWTDDERIIGDWGMGVRNARGHIFAAFLHGSRLAVSMTMLATQRDTMWTHELWSTKVRRQIDFILIDEVRNPTGRWDH